VAGDQRRLRLRAVAREEAGSLGAAYMTGERLKVNEGPPQGSHAPHRRQDHVASPQSGAGIVLPQRMKDG
jgi:hypothetical protein